MQTYKKGRTYKKQSRTYNKKGRRTIRKVKHVNSNKKINKCLLKYIDQPYYKDEDLSGKDFSNTIIHSGTFKNITFNNANLKGTKFINCFFKDVNFDGALVDKKTVFVESILKNCKENALQKI